MKKVTKTKRGGGRANSGRKSYDELGLEKKLPGSHSMYPSHKTKILKKFKTVNEALEHLAGTIK